MRGSEPRTGADVGFSRCHYDEPYIGGHSHLNDNDHLINHDDHADNHDNGGPKGPTGSDASPG